MSEKSYYENIADRVYDILENRGPNQCYENFRVEKYGQISYCIKALLSTNPAVKVESLKEINNLRNSLKEHLINDKPFNLIYIDDENLNYNFFTRLSDYFFNSGRHVYYGYGKQDVVPTVEEFSKTIKAFESMMPSVVFIIEKIPRNYGGKNEYLEYIPSILSLHNSNYYEDKTLRKIKSTIKEELEALTGPLCNEDDPHVKNGLISYLNNKKSLLTLINDREFELGLLENIKYIVASDYWVEVAAHLPNLSSAKLDTNSSKSKGMFNLNPNPIFHLDLDVKKILDNSPTLVTEEDFYDMLSDITKAINKNRPEGLDSIQNHDFRMIISGQAATEELAIKVGGLFEKMVGEYNSDSYLKKSFLTDEDKKSNENYLNTASQTYWLEIELEAANKSKVTSKRNKI